MALAIIIFGAKQPLVMVKLVQKSVLFIIHDLDIVSQLGCLTFVVLHLFFVWVDQLPYIH